MKWPPRVIEMKLCIACGLEDSIFCAKFDDADKLKGFCSKFVVFHIFALYCSYSTVIATPEPTRDYQSSVKLFFFHFFKQRDFRKKNEALDSVIQQLKV